MTCELILKWAVDHHRRTGRWPNAKSGAVLGVPDETWRAIDSALGGGYRGLSGRTSLARLLYKNLPEARPTLLRSRPPLTIEQILKWAELHLKQTGRRPTAAPGQAQNPRGESWIAINNALTRGSRGLPGNDSLARLLDRHWGARPGLSIKQILQWADEYHRQTGQWPKTGCTQPVPGMPGESWKAIDAALRRGHRGLPGRNSLPCLLRRRRGVPHEWASKPRLTAPRIFEWAQDHRGQTGKWPMLNSGSVTGQPGESWVNIDAALRIGCRGLPGGDSLRRLIRREEDSMVNPHRKRGPRLTIDLILQWADEHHRQTGRWPTFKSGRVAGVTPATTWGSLNMALYVGLRGLPGGSSLTRILTERRNAPYKEHGRRGTSPKR